jgi:hypothetical protein
MIHIPEMILTNPVTLGILGFFLIVVPILGIIRVHEK